MDEISDGDMTNSKQKEFDPIDLCSEVPIPAEIVKHISKQVAKIKSPTSSYADKSEGHIC